MKTKQLFTAMPVVCALLTGCNWDSPVNSIWPTNHSYRTMNAVSNGDIVQELTVINKAEIEAAKLARTRSNSPKVKQYAKLLEREHAKSLNSIHRLSRQTGIKPVTNMAATNLDTHSKQELARLYLLRDTAFDKAFIANMIDDHRAALQVIDQGLIQSTNAKLTTLLKATRQHVAMHLSKAEALQKQLGLN